MKSRTIAFFRGGFAVLYYALCVCFVGTVAFSVTYGAFRTTTGTDSVAPDSIQPDDGDGQQCFADLRALMDELHTEAALGFTGFLKHQNLKRWNGFSDNWRTDLTALNARCRLASSTSMAPMKQYAKDVERVHRAYDTSLRSYAERLVRSAPRLKKNQAILTGNAD